MPLLLNRVKQNMFMVTIKLIERSFVLPNDHFLKRKVHGDDIVLWGNKRERWCKCGESWRGPQGGQPDG